MFNKPHEYDTILQAALWPRVEFNPPIAHTERVQTQVNQFWELLEKSDLLSTYRAKVPGGWLVMQQLLAPNNRDHSQVTSPIFIPDPQHHWSIKPEFKK